MTYNRNSRKDRNAARKHKKPQAHQRLEKHNGLSRAKRKYGTKSKGKK